MKIYAGKGIKKVMKEVTFQDQYPEVVKCTECKCDSKPLMVIDDSKGELANLDIKRINGKPIWPHDSCSFVLYMCTDCGNVNAEWNQA